VPRYTYRCDVCEKCFEVFHSINEKLTDCDCGKEGSLVRIPSLPFCVSVAEAKQKPGEIVKEYIEDVRKEVKDYKKEMIDGDLDV
jgi:putative FmdB family regulatory protein